MKKKILIIIVLIIVIISVLFLLKNISIFTKNDNHSYICFMEQQNVEFATIDYYYKFDVVERYVNNSKQEMVFTYFEKSDYETSYVENSFTISAPDEIEYDDKKLKKSFIWNTIIPKETETIEEYIKTVETYGYKCEIVK